MGDSDILMLVGGVLLIDVLPRYAALICQYFGYESVPISSFFSMPFTSTILYFPLMGFYCEHKISMEKLRKLVPWLVGMLVVGVLIGTGLTIFQGVTTGFTQEYLSPCQHVTVPALYLLVKYMASKWQEKGINPHFQKVICTLGGLTLGVYLMDPMLHGLIFERGYGMLTGVVHPVAYSALYCLISLAVCSAITYVVKKIPVVGKLL